MLIINSSILAGEFYPVSAHHPRLTAFWLRFQHYHYLRASCLSVKRILVARNADADVRAPSRRFAPAKVILPQFLPRYHRFQRLQRLRPRLQTVAAPQVIAIALLQLQKLSAVEQSILSTQYLRLRRRQLSCSNQPPIVRSTARQQLQWIGWKGQVAAPLWLLQLQFGGQIFLWVEGRWWSQLWLWFVCRLLSTPEIFKESYILTHEPGVLRNKFLIQ